MTECPRRDAWLRGCRFEPRYDENVNNRFSVDRFNGTPDQFIRIIQASKPREYVRDVCVTCGRTVEREGK